MTISSHLSLVCVVDVVPVTVFDVAVDVVLVEDVAVEVAEVRVAVVTVPVVVGAGGRTRLNSCCFRELWDIIYIYVYTCMCIYIYMNEIKHCITYMIPFWVSI